MKYKSGWDKEYECMTKYLWTSEDVPKEHGWITPEKHVYCLYYIRLSWCHCKLELLQSQKKIKFAHEPHDIKYGFPDKYGLKSWFSSCDTV